MHYGVKDFDRGVKFNPHLSIKGPGRYSTVQPLLSLSDLSEAAGQLSFNKTLDSVALGLFPSKIRIYSYQKKHLFRVGSVFYKDSAGFIFIYPRNHRHHPTTHKPSNIGRPPTSTKALHNAASVYPSLSSGTRPPAPGRRQSEVYEHWADRCWLQNSWLHKSKLK